MVIIMLFVFLYANPLLRDGGVHARARFTHARTAMSPALLGSLALAIASLLKYFPRTLELPAYHLRLTIWSVPSHGLG